MTALEKASRALLDATTQDNTGRWIIEGDAEELCSDLLSALDGNRQTEAQP